MHPSVIARKSPDKPAVIMASTGETVTFGELDTRSNRGAQLFRSLGLQVVDGVAIFMENNARFHEICWAAQRAGLYFTAISSRLTAGEVEYIVKDSGAKVLIVGHTLARVAGEVAPLVPGVTLLTVGGTVPGYASYEDEA
ncbi:MAG: AMP-binding protein, partial [Steroidobacteraceae bacterium]